MGVDLFRGRNERICVLCGSNTMMYEENPPTTTGDVDGDVDITCLECGFSEYTHFTELTLEKVNDLRIEVGLDEIKQFKERKSKRTRRKGRGSKIPIDEHDKKVESRKKRLEK